ncbi:MAG TPA: SRPBCC family protein [Micromonosporaceae bacterium]|jgi:uncharacterized protein YndB with AHSA1/START domain|nr:SRPBCC family protein [Micromonosporaceae bacterium]
MPTITNTIDIKATPDRVWAVLADLPATRQWLPGVVAARVDGPVRVCRMADGQEVHEHISDIAPERRSYRFSQVRGPLPVHDSAGRFTVTPGAAAGTATVSLETTFEPLDANGAEPLAAMIHAAFQQALESLRRFVEDDRAWDAG